MTPIFDAPYYAVIFTSTHHTLDEEYEGLDDILIEIAKKSGGYLGMDSARSGLGISVSYWESKEDILRWKQNSDHQIAIKKGINKWYERYNVRICKVERNYEFSRMP
jgi:heme-degrading monooxygenase HmoA